MSAGLAPTPDNVPSAPRAAALRPTRFQKRIIIPALTPAPRYREGVAAVDKRSALKNVLGAVGLLLLAMFAGSLVAAVGDLFGDSENGLVTPIGVVTMALQLAIAAFVFRRAWHITSRDLGFVKEGALGSWLVGARAASPPSPSSGAPTTCSGASTSRPRSPPPENANSPRMSEAPAPMRIAPRTRKTELSAAVFMTAPAKQREDALDGVVDVDAVLGDVVP